MMFLSLLRLVVRYFFFKVYIGKKGFYFQSNPFDGKYYEYRKIRSYNEETILRQNRMRYFFSFTVKGGETKKFQLDRSVCGREITKLKKRINKASAEKTE